MQDPPIEYDTVGNVTQSVETNAGVKSVVLSKVVLLRGGNFNLFPPRAAVKASGGDVKRDKQSRECIMVIKDQQRVQVARARATGSGAGFLMVG